MLGVMIHAGGFIAAGTTAGVVPAAAATDGTRPTADEDVPGTYN